MVAGELPAHVAEKQPALGDDVDDNAEEASKDGPGGVHASGVSEGVPKEDASESAALSNIVVDAEEVPKDGAGRMPVFGEAERVSEEDTGELPARGDALEVSADDVREDGICDLRASRDGEGLPKEDTGEMIAPSDLLVIGDPEGVPEEAPRVGAGELLIIGDPEGVPEEVAGGLPALSDTTKAEVEDVPEDVDGERTLKSRDEPDPYCPICKLQVDEGESAVVCEDCDAYIHYACEGISEEEIEELGTKEFKCKKHTKEQVSEAGKQKGGRKSKNIRPSTQANENKVLKMAYERSENEKRELIKEMQDKDSKIIKLDETIKEKQKHHQDGDLQIKGELKIAKEHVKVLKDQIINLKAQQKQSHERNDNLTKEIKISQQKVEEGKKEIMKTKEENKVLLSHQATLRLSNSANKQEIDQLKLSQGERAGNDGGEVNTLKQQLKEKHKEIATLKENCKTYEIRLETLITDLMSKERVTLHLCENLENVKFINKELEMRLDGNNNRGNQQEQCSNEDKIRENVSIAVSGKEVEGNVLPHHFVEPATVMEEKEEGEDQNKLPTEDKSTKNIDDESILKIDENNKINRAKKDIWCKYEKMGNCEMGSDCEYWHKFNKDRGKYWRTKECKYHLRGVCKFGESCRFKHTDETPRHKEAGYTNVTNSEIWCRYGANCMRGDFCKFKHKEDKQRNDNERSRTNDQKMKYTVPSYKGENENRCRYGSSCTRGNTCKFKHEQNQRTSPCKTIQKT